MLAALSLLTAVFLAAVGAEDAVPSAIPVAALEQTADAAWPTTIAARLQALPIRVPASSDASTPHASLSAVLEPLVERAARQASVAVAVHDAVTGALLYHWDAERSLVPASNNKLVTAVAALDLLGPEFRFRTTLHRLGNTLYIRGEGDPSLQDDQLRALVRNAAAQTDLGGIEHIVFDDSAFSDRTFGPGYETTGPGHSWTAPSGALSLQFNTIEITVRGSKGSKAPQVVIEPSCDYVQVRTYAPRAKREPLRVTTSATDEHTVVHVAGRVPPGRSYKVRRRIHHPGRFTASVLARLLGQGNATLHTTRGRVPANAELVAQLQSPPLRELLGSALRFSNNFTAEQLLRTLGQRASGEPGDWSNGSRVLWHYWEALGADPTALQFENASGLSSRGRMTAASLARVLISAAHDDEVSSSLKQTLATAGRDGTMKSRLTRLRDRVQAKTGTLDDASALSGWLLSDDEPTVVFSILVNQAPSRAWARQLQDKIVLEVAAALDREPVTTPIATAMDVPLP